MGKNIISVVADQHNFVGSIQEYFFFFQKIYTFTSFDSSSVYYGIVFRQPDRS